VGPYHPTGVHLVSPHRRRDQRSRRSPNPFNTQYARGSGGFDRRHIFNASYVYALPFFKRSSNMAAKQILGDWGISGITVAESGVPQNVSYSPDTLGLGGGTSNRPNLVSKVTDPYTQTAWFDKSAYTDPLAPWAGGAGQGFGTAGKDNVVGPRLINFNLALTKTIQFTGDEGPNIELTLSRSTPSITLNLAAWMQHSLTATSVRLPPSTPPAIWSWPENSTSDLQLNPSTNAAGIHPPLFFAARRAIHPGCWSIQNPMLAPPSMGRITPLMKFAAREQR
jgi:hypothetical protein